MFPKWNEPVTPGRNWRSWSGMRTRTRKKHTKRQQKIECVTKHNTMKCRINVHRKNKYQRIITGKTQKICHWSFLCVSVWYSSNIFSETMKVPKFSANLVRRFGYFLHLCCWHTWGFLLYATLSFNLSGWAGGTLGASHLGWVGGWIGSLAVGTLGLVWSRLSCWHTV